jgi:DNA-binding NtrC family response regulator
MAEKQFREDLYYRINVMRIDLPPLRERPEDVAALASHFFARFKSQMQKDVGAISSEAMEVLQHHRWPGNIRELQNAVHRALIVCTGDEILPDNLPASVVDTLPASPTGSVTGTFFSLREQRLAAFELEYLRAQLERHHGDVAAAADEAEIPKGTYYRLMKKYDLTASQFKGK